MTEVMDGGEGLKPCPFCGGAASLMVMTKGAMKRGYQYVERKACGVDAGSVAAWNRRALSPIEPAGGEAALIERLCTAMQDGVGCTPWESQTWDRDGGISRDLVRDSVRRILAASPAPTVEEVARAIEPLLSGFLPITYQARAAEIAARIIELFKGRG